MVGFNIPGRSLPVRTRKHITVLMPCGPNDVEEIRNSAASIAGQEGVLAYLNVALDGFPMQERRDASRFLKQLPDEHEDIAPLKGRIMVYSTGPKPCGPAAACLQAMTGVGTPFLTRLDADDRVAAPDVYAHLTTMMDEARVWWAVGRQERFDGEHREPGPDITALTGRRWKAGELAKTLRKVSSPRLAGWGTMMRTVAAVAAGQLAYGYEDDTAFLAHISALASGVVTSKTTISYRRNREGQTTSKPEDKDREVIWRGDMAQQASQRYEAFSALGMTLDEFPGPLYKQSRFAAIVQPLAPSTVRSRPYGT